MFCFVKCFTVVIIMFSIWYLKVKTDVIGWRYCVTEDSGAVGVLVVFIIFLLISHAGTTVHYCPLN